MAGGASSSRDNRSSRDRDDYYHRYDDRREGRRHEDHREHRDHYSRRSPDSYSGYESDEHRRRHCSRSRDRARDSSYTRGYSHGRSEDELEEGQYFEDDEDSYDEYRWRRDEEETPNSTIMLRGLSPETHEHDIMAVLARHQLNPKDIRFLRHKDTGAPRGFAFVEFSSIEDSMRWMRETQGYLDIQGHRVTLCYSVPKDSRVTRSDWTCYRCGVSNFKRREQCFKCGTEREESEENTLDADVSPVPTNCLLLRNLSPHVTSDQVLELVGSLTNVPIKSIRVPMDPVSKTSRGICFLELHTTQEATQLLALLGSSNTVSLAASTPLIFSFARRHSSIASTPRTGVSNVASAALAAAQWTNNLPSTATPVAQSLGTVDVNGVTYPKFPEPDHSKFVLEKSSGFLYDHTTRLYYDPKSTYYYNSITQQYLYWSKEYSTYIPVPTQTTTSQVTSTSATVSNSSGSTLTTTVTSSSKPTVEKRKNRDEEEEETPKGDNHDKVKTAKKIAKDMEKWAKSLNQKAVRANVHEAFVDEDDDAPAPEKVSTNDSPQQQQQQHERDPHQVLAEEEAKLLDWDKLLCLLCKRQFASREQLTKHQTASGLHKSNLESLAQTLSVDVNSKPDSLHYVDRAKERRKKWGKEHQPIELPTKRESYQPSIPDSYAASSSKPIDSSNIGARMLKAMGWKEGQGLGKNNSGRTDIIHVEAKNETAGLGSRSSSTTETGESYKEAVKRVFAQRYLELSKK